MKFLSLNKQEVREALLKTLVEKYPEDALAILLAPEEELTTDTPDEGEDTCGTQGGAQLCILEPAPTKKKAGRKPTLGCCNTDEDLLLSAVMREADEKAASYEIRPGEEVMDFVMKAIDEKLARRFKGKGLGTKARGELAALVFGRSN
jgi:hypothetical protein